MGFRKADNRLGVMGNGLLAILLMVGLTACGGGGSSTPAAPAPTINVTASSATIAAGQPVTLTWTTTGATSVDLAEQVSASSVSAQDSQVGLIAVSGPNSCALYADPDYVHAEEREATDEGRETGGLSAAYAVDLNGSKTVSPSKTTTYKFTVTGAGGTITAQTTVNISSTTYNADALVREYNVDYPGGESYSYWWNDVVGTTRWLYGYIDVYDTTGSPSLQTAIDAWNTTLAGFVTLRKSTNPDSPVKVFIDTTISTWGQANYAFGNDFNTVSGNVRINPTAVNVTAVYTHELGHILGFYKHTTNDPNGIMNGTVLGSTITPLVYTMMHRLYELPIHTHMP